MLWSSSRTYVKLDYMSYIDIVVLRHLSARPTHGYELRKNVERTTGFTLHNNALYPALRRFEEAGAVVKRVEEQSGRPARIVYEITDVGREVLHDLIADLPVDQAGDDLEFLTRIGQFDLIEPHERTEVVRRRTEALRAQVAHLEEVESRAHDDAWGLVVLHELVRRAEQESAWLDSLDLGTSPAGS